MKFILLIFIISWLLRFLQKLLFFLQLWWLKEYRIDRIVLHFKTAQGKQLIIGKPSLFLYALIVLWTLGVPMIFIEIVALGFYLLYALRSLKSGISTWVLPPLTIKIVTLATIII